MCTTPSVHRGSRHNDGLAVNDVGPPKVAANVNAPGPVEGGTQFVRLAPTHGGQFWTAADDPAYATTAGSAATPPAPASAVAERPATSSRRTARRAREPSPTLVTASPPPSIP